MPRSRRKHTGPTAPLMVRVFNGAREVMPEGLRILYRCIDGNHKQQLSRFSQKPVLRTEVPFSDNLADRYTVIVSAKDHLQTGFTPILVQPGVVQFADLMLLPRNNTFSFSRARWDKLSETHPHLIEILSQGASQKNAQDRYSQWMEEEPASVAAFLNITEALGSILLPAGRAVDYFKNLIWDDPQADLSPDRFFGYADARLLDQLTQAVQHGTFKEVPLPGLFHPGATRSFKEVRFGEANVQLTFHEKQTLKVGGIPCVKVEADMDYYRDQLAHTLLEVLPNTFGGRTDPRQIYVLRWIAGRRAGVENFNPPYEIQAA